MERAQSSCRMRLGGRTGVFDFMVCVAEDFEGTAKLLGAEGRMESEEDLNHGNRSVSAIFYCTHLEVCFNCFSMILNPNCMCCAKIRAVF